MYIFKLSEEEIRRINAALEHARLWSKHELLKDEKAIDALQNYMADEVAAQTKPQELPLVSELRRHGNCLSV
jgi:ABC-type phosphate transport system auxiliary subunit